MSQPRKCCPHRVDLAEGVRVHTFKDSMPISHGVVLTVSECGRFARVRKDYGRKHWTKLYKAEDLHPYREGRIT